VASSVCPHYEKNWAQAAVKICNNHGGMDMRVPALEYHLRKLREENSILCSEECDPEFSKQFSKKVMLQKDLWGLLPAESVIEYHVRVTRRVLPQCHIPEPASNLHT